MAKRKKRPPKRSTARTRVRETGSVFTSGTWLPLACAVAITVICYLRTTGYDFVNWDDDFNISENPNLRHFDWANIKGIFTSHVIGNYNPLTTLSFAIEKHFFGLNPGVFHAMNVVLHSVCTFLFFWLVRLLGMALWPAVVAALIFGIHPMRVESVAWITERKDVLFGAFYLAALILYIKWYKAGRPRRYVVYICILFILSLLSKIQAVALPLSMLAIDFLLARKIRWKLLIEKIPYFVLSAVTGLAGVYFLAQQGSLDSTAQFSLPQRLIIGMYSFDIYLIKFIAPYKISPLYPYPGVLPWYFYTSPVMVIAVLFFFWKAWQHRWRPAVFGLAFFTFNVAFVLQVVGAGQGFLADRFTYIPYAGLIFMLVYYGEALRRSSASWHRAVLAACTLWIAALLIQTWRHVPVWENSGTLWTHVLKYYDKSPLPYRNRAQYYRNNQQYDLALADYNRSIALKKDADVINSRARMYFDQQHWREAIEDYNEAIALKPTGEFYINRGAAYAMLGDMQNALRDMTEGINLDPNFANGYRNRSLVYQTLGQTQNAHSDVLNYLQLNPYDAELWYENARYYRMFNNEEEAVNALTRAIAFSQRDIFYFERSKALLALGRKAEAQRDLNMAEQLGMRVDAQTRAAYQ